MSDPLRVVFHPTGAALLARAGALLERAEAENNLLLGVAAALGDRPPPSVDPPLLATVERDGEAVASALWTPPFKLALSRAPEAAARALAEAVRAAGREPPGVLAEEGTAHAFARAWCAATGQTSRTEMRQRLYELTEVILPRAVAGRLREAGEADAILVAAWVRAFAGDTRLAAPSEAEALTAVRRGIEKRAFFLWDTGEPVSLAAAVGWTRSGVRLNQVYTPPELRGHGYASACVAALSQRMLEAGRRFTMLFTDRDNATSNHIYQAIGYRAIMDAVMLELTAA